MWHLYILRCADGVLYIGATNHLDERIAKHDAGRASTFTASRRPVTLAYSESHTTRDAAVAQERQLKRRTRAKRKR